MTASMPEDFAGEFTKRFSQGEEMDVRTPVDQAVADFFSNMPEEITEFFDQLDPSLRKVLEWKLEDNVREVARQSVDIGEDAERYQTQYEKWGWQFDETNYVPSDNALADIRRNALSRLATGMTALIEQRATEERTI